MDEKSIISKLEEIAKPVIEKLGMDLYDLEYKRESNGWVVRVFIDKRDGGVSIDDCVKVSRQLNVLLDVEDIIPHSYNLEVSSPGLTRALKKLSHYEKSVGLKAKIKIKEPLNNRKTFSCVIEAVEGDDVLIDVEGEKIKINFNNIENAKLQID